MNKGGRPRKSLTDEQKAQVEALAAVLSQDQVADYFGIARNTFSAMMERDQEVFERYKRGKARAIKDVSQGLLQKALQGDTVCMMFYLKTQAGWREKDKPEEDKNQQPINITFAAVEPPAK
jgi:hypothetical protein